MDLLVLGAILCVLFFWGQIRKNIRVLWPTVAVAFLTGGVLCALGRWFVSEFDTPSLIGAWLILGTAFYAFWRRFFHSGKKNKKRL